MSSYLKSKVCNIIIDIIETVDSNDSFPVFITAFSISISINRRCSRCKKIYYCSAEHQKVHWRLHKGVCNASIQQEKSKQTPSPDNAADDRTESNKSSSSNNNSNGSSSSSGNSKLNTSDQKDTLSGQESENEKNEINSGEQEKKTVRCMFCGDQLVLASEEEAVDHMRTCVALQEQLNSKDQFTIPKKIREEKNI
jgi:phage FluMu protein Com